MTKGQNYINRLREYQITYQAVTDESCSSCTAIIPNGALALVVRTYNGPVLILCTICLMFIEQVAGKDHEGLVELEVEPPTRPGGE